MQLELGGLVSPEPPTRPNSNRALSPKRPQVETAGLADLFPYYAGFSFDWACQALSRHNLGVEALVLDPWNGSGTTTAAASFMGMRGLGVDLNPVANIVAQLRTISSDVAILDRPKGRLATRKSDPLEAWFSSASAGVLRAWSNLADSADSPTRVLALVAIFRVVRRLTQEFQGSNPTWVRRTSRDRPQVSVSRKELDQLIEQEQAFLKKRILDDRKRGDQSTLIAGSANALPLQDGSVDFVLTSPPYLTRIDYAVAYSRELAVLGLDISADRGLRGALMGTTLIRPGDSRSFQFKTATAQALVADIAEHDSHASGVYYLKQACQYLMDLNVALDELTRVCKVGAKAILVVQDSYYKDIPVYLARIYEEEAARRGWSVFDSEPFDVTRTLTSLNRAAKNYQKGRVQETVLTIQLDRGQ